MPDVLFPRRVTRNVGNEENTIQSLIALFTSLALTSIGQSPQIRPGNGMELIPGDMAEYSNTFMLQVKRMREYELDFGVPAGFRQPMPLETALAHLRQVVAAGLDQFQEKGEIISLEFFMDQDVALPAHDADRFRSCISCCFCNTLSQPPLIVRVDETPPTGVVGQQQRRKGSFSA